jgi:alpha-glucosidase
MAELADPSLSLLPSVKPTGPAPAGFPVEPKLFSLDGDLSVHIDIPRGTSLYATGEVNGPLLRNGRYVSTWNTDAPGSTEAPPGTFQSLYQSHPWILAVRPDGTAFGILADTPFRTMIEMANGINIKAEGPVYPVIVIDRASPLEVVQALADLTGHIEMPPRWALGFHQSRESYPSEDKVREIAAEFRKRKLPCDSIGLDSAFLDRNRPLTFDPSRFADPARLAADLHSQGFKLIARLDPGVPVERGFAPFDSGSSINAWVTEKDRSICQAESFAGPSVFPDFTRKKVREWWGGLVPPFMARGFDGLAISSSEPAILKTPSRTVPLDARHDADPDLGGPGPHAKYHNVYSPLMARATRDGMIAASPDKRPFLLSRANFIGGQQYAAAWTGQNNADWTNLEASIPMTLNLGLSGQPLAGADIGGFIGNGPSGTEGELFVRWMGIGTLLPLARANSGPDTINKEPWAFDSKIESTCRQALERRYRLLPYLYTLAEEAHRIGSPIVRPAFFADPKDSALRSEDDTFLLGADVLVVPQVAADRSRVPARPLGLWRQFGFDDARNPDLPALYLRGGAILPTGPVMQFTSERPLDELTLLVCLDESNKASGTLYEDDGEGWAFRDGQFRRTTFAAERTGQKVTVRVASVDGKMPRTDRKVAVRVLAGIMEVYGYGTESQGVEVIINEPVARPDHKP